MYGGGNSHYTIHIHYIIHVHILYIKAMQPPLDNIKVQSAGRILLIGNGALKEKKNSKFYFILQLENMAALFNWFQNLF